MATPCRNAVVLLVVAACRAAARGPTADRFDASHQVDEALIVDPAERTVHWLALQDGKGARSSTVR
jgi:hypothetical protein